MNHMSKAGLWWILPLALAWACGSSGSGDNSGSGASGQGASSSTAGSNAAGDQSLAGDNGTGTAGSLNTGGTKGSGGSTGTAGTGGASANPQCSDGIDNDGDGLIDGFDPECTGPNDNDESSFATGIPGDNRDPKWQDCFFDGNSGAGDDGCRYSTGCLTGALPPTDKNCQLTDACVKFCAKFTPNGCDCFGCCTVQKADGQTVDIELNSTCSIAKVDDPDACTPCHKTDQCGNTCGRCELCPGKTEADLPADCGPTTGGGGAGSGGTTGTGGTGMAGGPSYTCDNGEQVCGTGLPACGISYYCSLGCCIPKPPR